LIPKDILLLFPCDCEAVVVPDDDPSSSIIKRLKSL
jgi:hypothetical protein